MKSRIDVSRLKKWIRPISFYQGELGLNGPMHLGGWIEGGICPFHADTRPGSFRLNMDCGAFRCFACGAKGGDIIAFARMRHGLGFRDAIEYIETKVGGRHD